MDWLSDPSFSAITRARHFSTNSRASLPRPSAASWSTYLKEAGEVNGRGDPRFGLIEIGPFGLDRQERLLILEFRFGYFVPLKEKIGQARVGIPSKKALRLLGNQRP